MYFKKNMECDMIVGTVQSVFGLKSDVNMLNKYKCDHVNEN